MRLLLFRRAFVMWWRAGLAIALMAAVTPAHGQTPTPWRMSLAAGPLLLPNGSSGAYGPMAAIAVGRRVGSRVLIQAVLDGAPLGHAGGEDVTSPGPCTTCDVVDGPREPRLALAGSLEARLYDRAGERGGYVAVGAGAVRYSAAGEARVRPRVHFGLGGAFSANPGSLFIEARLARTIDPGPYARWGFGALIGWRFAL